MIATMITDVLRVAAANVHSSAETHRGTPVALVVGVTAQGARLN
jgi:hypothetical protein